jgi:hypothetical protein
LLMLLLLFMEWCLIHGFINFTLELLNLFFIQSH